MTDLDDDEVHAEGHESYHAGLLPTDNPYMRSHSIAWSRGYDAAKAEGPPVPTASAAILRRDALFNRAIDALEKAAVNYIDALQQYYASDDPPTHKDKHDLYEEMLEFIEQQIGTHRGYARDDDDDAA